MHPARRSRTADAAAAVRAAHLLYDRPVIFADPFAIDLTSAAWRTICRTRILHRLISTTLLRPLRPVHGQVLARSRYAEERLETAVRAGVTQYVILSAGLDSFCLRKPTFASTIRTYELDHPATQRTKRMRLDALGLGAPKRVEFVPVDLEKDTLRDALARSTWSHTERTFFSWLGTVPYLTPQAFMRTLADVRAIAAPGSEIVFDYLIPERMVPDEYAETVAQLRKFTRGRGEPIVDKDMHPESVRQMAGALGFDLIEDVSPNDQRTRYFHDRTDDLQPLAWSHFAHLRVPATPVHRHGLG